MNSNMILKIGSLQTTTVKIVTSSGLHVAQRVTRPRYNTSEIYSSRKIN